MVVRASVRRALARLGWGGHDPICKARRQRRAGKEYGEKEHYHRKLSKGEKLSRLQRQENTSLTKLNEKELAVAGREVVKNGPDDELQDAPLIGPCAEIHGRRALASPSVPTINQKRQNRGIGFPTSTLLIGERKGKEPQKSQLDGIPPEGRCRIPDPVRTSSKEEMANQAFSRVHQVGGRRTLLR